MHSKKKCPAICCLGELSDTVTAVANRAIQYGTENTNSGNRIFCADDFDDLISSEDFEKYFDLIIAEVASREEILDLIADDEKYELDCNFGLAYCRNYQWCDGDEEIFGSFEEWEKMEVRPVSQPLSMSRMAQIGVEAVRSVQEWFDDPAEKLTGSFGISIEELGRLRIKIGKEGDVERNPEFRFMVSFAMQSCFDEDICRDHFRMLWTAYCLHQNLDVDTTSYDSDLRKLWEVVALDEEDTADWSDFDSFDAFMCRYLV